MCSECGNESPVWQGQCRSCGAWNSYKEFKESPVTVSESFRGDNLNLSEAAPKKLSTIDLKNEIRLKSSIDELDQTLGGGMVPGQVILLGGNPGVGKSTLIMQLASSFQGKVLYVSGEESETQVALRGSRLGVSKDQRAIMSTSNVHDVLKHFDHDLLIIDSIQTLGLPDVSSSIGSVTQVKETAFKIITLAKQKNIPAIIIGHITKEGQLAGPKLLEHMVDTVLYLEGDKSSIFRLLRVQKNRFGDDSEVGIFEMKSDGMAGVKDPYLFLGKDLNDKSSGNVVSVIMEGKRPLAVEVQALTVKTSFGYAKRTSSGFSLSRLQLLCAVLEKKAHINLSDQDVYLNIASGLQIKEPAIDLAVCMAIISSYKDRSVNQKITFFGEVGLSGEVRAVVGEEKRIKESGNLGFESTVSSRTIKNISKLIDFLA